MKLSGILGLRPATFKYITTGVAALGALAMSAQADAADMYAPVGGGYKDVPVLLPPPPLWTGFYAGVNMGAAWSNLNINQLYEPNSMATGGYYTSCLPASGGGYCIGGDHLNSTNAFGGGQLGYNWQGWGNFVVGVEADLEGVAGGNERSVFGVAQNQMIPYMALALRSLRLSRRMAVSLAILRAGLATLGATGCSMRKAVLRGSIHRFQPGPQHSIKPQEWPVATIGGGIIILDFNRLDHRRGC